MFEILRTYFESRFPLTDEGENLEYTEQVARFSLTDFGFMFAMNYLEVEAVYGDYKLNEYDSKKSPRLIIVARKNGN